MTKTVLGIDIGGSHITAALVDLKTRSIVKGSSHRLAVNANGSAGQIFSDWCSVINAAFQDIKTEDKRIGISMPGPFDYKEGVCLIKDQPKFKSLYLLNIKNELSARLNMPAQHIRLVNDAAGFLQGEVFSGAAQDGKNIIGLTLGTGLGSAFSTQGIAVDAELWQSKFKKDIAEAYLSTRWFVERYFQLTGEHITGVKEINLPGKKNSAAAVIFKEFAQNLADFLLPIITQQKADTVVLGGNIAKAYPAFLPLLNEYLSPYQLNTRIKIAILKEDAALIGAASSWEFQLHQ
ncbi:ROK family protein [Pedobacter sp.]|uniref:ROK family protein n=1 Tax=Pedobacter sp. TaxID=1411316 RepID=UPI003D7FE198